MIVKVQEAVEAIEIWMVVRRMKSLRHYEGTTNQYDIYRAARNGFEFATVSQSSDPISFMISHDNQEKDSKSEGDSTTCMVNILNLIFFSF